MEAYIAVSNGGEYTLFSHRGYRVWGVGCRINWATYIDRPNPVLYNGWGVENHPLCPLWQPLVLSEGLVWFIVQQTSNNTRSSLASQLMYSNSSHSSFGIYSKGKWDFRGLVTAVVETYPLTVMPK